MNRIAARLISVFLFQRIGSMGILKVYRTLSEKRTIYAVNQIKTKTEVDNFLTRLASTQNKSIWRGMPESNFKHYTSLQRFWIEHDLSQDQAEVETYLRHVYEYSKKWNSDFFLKYFGNYGIAGFSIHSALSILRHHGTPTPMLDWSRNPLVSLFFAAESANIYPTENELENFFSLYELTINHPYYLNDMKDITFEYAKMREAELKTLNRAQAEQDADFISHFTQAYVNDAEMFFSAIRNTPIFRIQDLISDKIKYFVNNNYNITNQEGLFILNAFPVEPLEEAIIIRAKQHAKRAKLSATKVKETLNKHKQTFVCYDFHKSLKHYVLKELDKRGITEGYIYPNLKRLAVEAVSSYMSTKPHEEAS